MSTPVSPAPSKTSKLHLLHRSVLSLCFIAFAAELSFCLLILPWRRDWDMNYVPVHIPKLADFWVSYYFRGLLTGLGLLNVYVALAETGRLLRNWFGKP